MNNETCYGDQICRYSDYDQKRDYDNNYVNPLNKRYYYFSRVVFTGDLKLYSMPEAQINAENFLPHRHVEIFITWSH